MGYIYLIENLINGKKYIGQTIQNDINKRWNKHKQVNKNIL
jgi:predicted GIY-YIG superfamily endonuclease